MADKETIDDIIAEIRAIANEKRRANDPREYEAAVSMNDYADRLDAAHKRGVDKLNSVIQATVSRSDAEIDRLRREIAELKQAGNAAKLREAVVEARRFVFAAAQGQRDILVNDKINEPYVIKAKDTLAKIDSALKREVATDENSSAVGNAAKLREVCEQFLELLAGPAGFEDGGMDVELDENQVVMWRNRFRAALAATEKEGGER